MTPEPHSQQSSKPNLRTTMWRNARVWKAEACSRIFSEQRTVLCTHLRFWPTSRAAPLLHTLPAMLGSQSCTQRTDDRWRQKALRDVQAAEEGVGTGTSVIYTRKAKWNPNRDWGVRASSPSRETRDRPFGFNSRLWISGHHEVVGVFQVNRHKSFAVLATSRCTRSPLKESVAWNCSFSMIPWPDGAVLLVLSGLILEAVVVCRVSQCLGSMGMTWPLSPCAPLPSTVAQLRVSVGGVYKRVGTGRQASLGAVIVAVCHTFSTLLRIRLEF